MVKLLYTHYWDTEESHSTNNETMHDFLENEMDVSWLEISNDGTQAIVMDDCGREIQVDVSGNGDFNNHKAELTLIDDY